MKKAIILIVALVILILIAWLGVSSVAKLKTKEEVKEVQNSLESIFSKLGIYALETNRTTLIIYFNSECEFCQWEVEEISKHFDEFENVQMAFVSHEPEDEAIQFLKSHNLDQFYLTSRTENVMSTFTGSVPQLFIYKQGKLVNQFKGEVKIELILEALRK